MICKNCQYPHSHVVYTRHTDFNNQTERRRECLKCGARFTTHEKLRVKPTHDKSTTGHLK
jgi:transcriptional repressor NrdR